MERYIQMDFGYAYNLAGHLKKKILENNQDDYILDFIDLDLEKAVKPNTNTILHTYIKNELFFEIEYIGQKGDPDTLAPEWESLLKAYKCKIKKKKKKSSEYIHYLEHEIKKYLIPKIANETFQLLFGDRMFCLSFNKLIADYIKDLKTEDFPAYLKSDGKVKRCSYFPTWVQKAVFLRDRGCCAICLNDLSGLLKTDFNKELDHIVPLNLGGVNDISNLQLLCKKCNNKKLGNKIITSKFYPVYFPVEI
ncbi:HNH endonuclease [Chryseobacterium bernardetii]|uniref:HNH endonuclease n=1 Tax=Chryseobacterium bernardetii TaxID=1241978 RepID=A0A3G6TL94_9FLAO|nr:MULTISPECIES: HNH endonuclease signature motif containing protein [Chryseobacterium]AZB27416.1 HNH endonuclease [Chryseobacterium bernardetii]